MVHYKYSKYLIFIYSLPIIKIIINKSNCKIKPILHLEKTFNKPLLCKILKLLINLNLF